MANATANDHPFRCDRRDFLNWLFTFLAPVGTAACVSNGLIHDHQFLLHALMDAAQAGNAAAAGWPRKMSFAARCSRWLLGGKLLVAAPGRRAFSSM
jgi:hypothetical protein